MKKILPLLALACWFSCRATRPALAPGAGPCFRVMSLKFSFRAAGERQSGRVACRFDEARAKFVFFTPLNQAGLELAVDGEEAVLANFSAQTYWQGDFSLLLGRLWGIELPLAELKALLLDGRVPPSLAARGIEVALQGDPGASPRQVNLRRGEAALSLLLLKSELRPGRIVPVDYATRYRRAGLEEVLEP